MLGIEVELLTGRGHDAAHFEATLNGLERRSQDMQPAMEAIYKSFLKTEQGFFASNNGGRWEPLTPAYAARKARKGLEPDIEKATGELYAALGRGVGPGAVHEVDRDGITMGTNLRKAVYAQRSTQNHRRRRRLVAADAVRRKKWMGIIRAYLIEAQAGG
jgi:hypothetical protein